MTFITDGIYYAIWKGYYKDDVKKYRPCPGTNNYSSLEEAKAMKSLILSNPKKYIKGPYWNDNDLDLQIYKISISVKVVE